jgi:hypothetical protein
MNGITISLKMKMVLLSVKNCNLINMKKLNAKQVKVNNGNTSLADAMVRIYKHNFLIRK